MLKKQRLLSSLLGATIWLVALAGIAHAHGGMAGPDVMGPPVGTSIAIGLACYYLITLWPSRRHGGDDQRSSAQSSRRVR